MSASSAERVSAEIVDVSDNAARTSEISSSVKKAALDLTALGENMSKEITNFLRDVREDDNAAQKANMRIVGGSDHKHQVA